jgi:hypothetical protein
VTKILVVGWKGAETHFTKMLRDYLRPKVDVLIVAETEDAANPTVSQMRAISPQVKVERFGGGFSEFVVSRAAEDFFRSTN